MALGIGSESTGMVSSTTDVDFYRYKYRDSETQLDGSTVDVSFVSPIFSVFEKYRFYLLENSTKVQLKTNYRYRPDYVSYEYYGTTAWWQLVMWINDVKALEYFTADFIIVPTPEAVAILQNEAYSAGTYLDINEDEKHTKTQMCLFETPADNITELAAEFNSGTLTQLTDSEEEEEEKTVFMREIFKMDIPTLRLKYVDLKYEPIENSVKVLANCRPNLIYDKHYTLIQDDNDKSIRITWDPAQVNNAGLLFKLKEDDLVEVQYMTKAANVDETTTSDTTARSTESDNGSSIDTSTFISKQTSLQEIDTNDYTDSDVVNKVNELVSIVKNGSSSTSRNMSSYLRKQKTAKSLYKLDFTEKDEVAKVNQLVRFFKNGVLKSVLIGLALIPTLAFGKTGLVIESQEKQRVKNYTPIVTSVTYDTVNVPSTETDKRVEIGDDTLAETTNGVNDAVAIGYGAHSLSNGSVQVGCGTNTTPRTLKFRNLTIADEEKLIPETSTVVIGPGGKNMAHKGAVSIGGSKDFPAETGSWFTNYPNYGAHNIAIGTDIQTGVGDVNSAPPRYAIGIGTTLFSQYMYSYCFGSQLSSRAQNGMIIGYGGAVTSQWSTVIGMGERPVSTMFFTNEVDMTNHFMNVDNRDKWFVDMGINIGTANTIDYCYGVSEVLVDPDPETGMYVKLEYDAPNYKLGGRSWKYGKSHGKGTFNIVAIDPSDKTSRGLKAVYINDDSLDDLIQRKIGTDQILADISGQIDGLLEDKILKETSVSNLNNKIVKAQEDIESLKDGMDDIQESVSNLTDVVNDHIETNKQQIAVLRNDIDINSNRTAAVYAPVTTNGIYDGRPDYRVQIGREAVADGWSSSYHQSIAIGADSKAHAAATTAVGPDAEANGEISVALGWRSITLGKRGVAIGSGIQAGQDYWLDETTTRTNRNPKANYAEAYGDYSVGIGYNFKAKALNSIAIGNSAYVSGANSVQLGMGTNSTPNTLKFNNVTIVKDGKIVGAVEEGFASNTVTKASLEPKQISTIDVNDDCVAKVDVNPHTINTLNFENDDVEELHMFPVGSRNYEVFIPDNAKFRSLMPITVKADLVSVTNSVILMNQTNVITRLPVMIKCREPMVGTVILSYEYFDNIQ